MYQENETLILLQDVGKEDTDTFIPKDTEVTFVKAMDNPRDLSKAIVVIKYQDRTMALPELAVKPKADKTIDALKDFNKQIMKSRPELKMYHHNIFMRALYKLGNALNRLLIQPFVVLHKKITAPVSLEKQEDKVAEELKKLINKED